MPFWLAGDPVDIHFLQGFVPQYLRVRDAHGGNNEQSTTKHAFQPAARQTKLSCCCERSLKGEVQVS